MKINNTNLAANYIKDVKTTYSHEVSKQSDVSKQKLGSDKLEISNEAKSMVNQTANVKDLAAIKQKIDNGFYNSEEVIQKVASAILKEINKA